MRDSFLCATVGLGDVMTGAGAGLTLSSCWAFGQWWRLLLAQTVSNGEWAFSWYVERKEPSCVVYRGTS
jgi:hypothetical protein